MTKYIPVTDIGECPSARPPATLVIGDLERWRRAGRELPDSEGVMFVGIAQLTAELITCLAPEIIISPLITAEFDAIDVARRLVELEYTGRYRVINDSIADASVIIGEIEGIAPALDFGVV